MYNFIEDYLSDPSQAIVKAQVLTEVKFAETDFSE